MSFSFGTPKSDNKAAPTSSFSFGQIPQPATTTAIGGFTAPSSLSLGQTEQKASPFSLTAAVQPQASMPSTTGFNLPLGQPAFGKPNVSQDAVKPATGSSFSFGQPKISGTPSSQVTTGFSLPAQKPAQQPAAIQPGFGQQPSGFSLGGVAAQPSTGSFSLAPANKSLSANVTSTAVTVPGALPSFSIPVASTAAATPGSTLGGFGKPISTTASTVPSAGLVLGSKISMTSTTSTGFKLGNLKTATAPLAQTTTPSVFTNLMAPSTTPANVTPLGIKSTLPATSVAVAATTGLSATSVLGVATTAPGKSFAAVSTLPTSTITAPPTTTATSGSGDAGGGVPPATGGGGASMTYYQLEESMNKWNQELEDQERLFLQEASKLNSWERTLVENGDRIVSLHDHVEECETEQTRLDQELDFIEAQQRELESVLEPLERCVEDLPPGHQHADREREAIFQQAQNADLELNQLLSDIREVVDRVNETNTSCIGRLGGGEDAGSLGGDVFGQVTKIINAHMHSLNWIHENTQNLMDKVKLLEEG